MTDQSRDTKTQPPEKKVIKEFGLTNLSLANSTTVFILIFLISFLGIWSYISMPKESFPEAIMPEIYIGTTYPGNSPLDMENLITRPIENEVNTISGVDKITSTSIQDYSTIIVKFESDIEVEEALQDVKDAVDKVKKDLPSDLDQDPNVFDVNMSEFPVMNINLSGDFNNEELKEYAEYLEDEIEKLIEISKAEIRGLQEREVKINVDIHKMAALEISFQDIENAIRAENVTISGGNIKVDDLRRTIRVIGEFSDPADINEVIVKHEKQNIVYLGDIADINFDYAERSSYARNNKEAVVMVDVVKRSGENLIAAAKQIQAIITEAKEKVFPPDLEISITNDQSKQTISMVNNLENSIISGVILVVLVLLFFLGLRNALFVGIAIPLSMFTAFFILDSMGVTMNMMVLFSTILALGMLVDNGIVVVENIYRLMDEGYHPVRAAKEGVGEVALPIIASTATTLAAFLPLAIWPGIMGEFMFYLPLSLMIVLASSLFVALVINPVLTSRYMRVGQQGPVNKRKYLFISLGLLGFGLLLYLPKWYAFSNLFFVLPAIIIFANVFFLTPGSKWFQDKLLPILENTYYKFLSFALRRYNPVFFFFGTIGMLFFSFILMGVKSPKVIFFPINEPHYVNVFIEKPIGTDIEETNRFTDIIEEKVINLIEEKNYWDVVEAVIAQVGEGTSDPMEGPSTGNTPHKARITVAFVDYQERGGINTTNIMEEIRAEMGGYPGVDITVDKDPAGPPMPKPINIEIVGEDFEVLLTEAEKMKKFINSKNINGIEALKTDVQLGSPEMIVDIDRKKARRFGVSSQRIAMELRTALFGKEVSKYKVGEDEYPIQLRLQDKYRYDADALINQKVTFRDQTNGKIVQVPISSLASTNLSSSYSAVKRKNLDRAITLSSNVTSGFNENEVVEEIKAQLTDYELPRGYYFKFTGQQEEQAKEMAFLSKALVIAVFLIFLIIVSQFNSFSTPFIIMGSVMFSFIGVLMGLIIFDMDFVIIMTMMGIISLAGIVVNNAIVLVDYTGLVRQRRRKELGLADDEVLPGNELIQSIVQGGKTRLRPVLLTAITTLLGLLPLATGMNINYFTLLSDFDPQISFGSDNVIFWGPLSWTVIFGLTFATFLTLVIVPVMYLLADKLKIRLSRLLGKKVKVFSHA